MFFFAVAAAASHRNVQIIDFLITTKKRISSKFIMIISLNHRQSILIYWKNRIIQFFFVYCSNEKNQK
jgi:hypothetical protein